MTVPNILQNEDEFQQQFFSSDHQINLAMASEFLSILAEGENVTFQTFDDNKIRSNENRKTKGYDPFAHIYHGTLDQHVATLERQNRQGSGVFV